MLHCRHETKNRNTNRNIQGKSNNKNSIEHLKIACIGKAKAVSTGVNLGKVVKAAVRHFTEVH